MIKKYYSLFFLFLLQGILPVHAFGADIVLMVLDHNSYAANLAVRDLDLPVSIQIITAEDVTRRPGQAEQDLDKARIVVVDVMGREMESFLTRKTMAASKTVYALRGSLDDASLKKTGILFDDRVAEYYRYLSVKNIRNMLRFVAHRHFDSHITFAPVARHPLTGLYHPDAPGVFTRAGDYLSWQQNRPGFDRTRPSAGFLFFSSFLTNGQKEPVDTVIRRLEAEGFNVLPCFGREQAVIENFLLDDAGKARIDMMLAFSFKFYHALTPELGRLLSRLDVPIFSAVGLYKDTIGAWRKSPVGISPLETAWSLAVPEISGLIEPTVLTAKEKVFDPGTGKAYFLSRPVPENLDRLIPRMKNWITLQQTPNAAKKVAVLFYNHHQGKQNIGASYLNVFRSMERIMAAMHKNGYATGSPLTEAEIKNMILATARNIGSWAPGELDKMLARGGVVRLPQASYKRWFEDLPKEFKEKVIEQWGEPETTGIMKKDTDFIIPAVQAGNLVILPEPARGWGDDPMKLYHDTTLYPHHQYLAVYLWLQKEFKAHAMIHLGTHATYEWTPGKQAGLSPACPPEVLITDIPNIYPYIVDNLGEGIQAKRRGRGVMLSHLTPVLKQADIHAEYSRMAELINEIERAEKRGSMTAAEKTKELMALARGTGILADMKNSVYSREHDRYHALGDGPSPSHSHTHEPSGSLPDETAETVHLLGHYLEDIKSEKIPFGMHTFGRSPAGEARSEMAGAVLEQNPHLTPDQAADAIGRCGPNEIQHLLKGLAGRYVPPGQGNDPVRNPQALPTGRNFYGFNPSKLPSPAAWELGKKAAQQIIDNHIIKHGSFPQKVAVVLWATETLRNEGMNEATIMTLIGTRPKWSETGRVLGIELMDTAALDRPRIDVVINASGLYRDLFPDKITYLDQAIRLAARQTDVENLIAKHNAQIKSRLISRGMPEETADEMSRFRIFSEPPGAYGTGVAEMASGSSKWENPDDVVDVFENRIGFAFGQGRSGRQWGLRARNAFRAHLSQVDVAVHSRSSHVYGMLDNDDMFQYLGGLSMAVRREAGRAPETLVTRQLRKNRVDVENAGKSIGREMRTRYLNPKWIRGMKAEGYAGANAMSNFVEYLWGWHLTTPQNVDARKWQQTYDVYVKDKYGLGMKAFFEKASPWAFQSITGRMLETARKDYWKPDPGVLETLAAEYAKSVITRGIACCDHTCNNPLLNQMVVSIISVPGVLSPELVAQFKLAVEQTAQKSLEEQVRARGRLLEKLSVPAPEKPAADPPAASEKTGSQEVEGYKMEPVNRTDDTTQMTSSGIEWMAVLAVLAVIGLISFGIKRKTA